MKAAVLVEVNQPLVLENLQAATLGPNDVRVQIEATGVCHSDLTVANGGFPYPPPLILGHEGAGTVIEIGDAVRRVKLGDRVICAFTPTCGRCWHCLRDEQHLCTDMSTMFSTKATRDDGTKVKGMSGLGTFSEHMKVHEDYVVPVRTDLAMDQLALIGCGATTGIGAALNTARVKPGSTVAVIGCGGVGHFTIMGAVMAGAAHVIAVDLELSKRQSALKIGATDSIDPRVGDVAEQIKSVTGGRGADYVFEVVGRPETMKTAIDSTRRGGTTVLVGMPRMDDQLTLPAFPLFFDAKTIIGCSYGSARVRSDFQRWIDLIESGRLVLSKVITKHYSLDDINVAIDDLKAGSILRGVIV